MSYRFSDIIDLSVVQRLMESLWKAAGIPTGIIDVDGTVLIATGWQKICTEYHRRHPETAKRCRESDSHIAGHLVIQEPGAAIRPVEYRCSNGMVDIGVPIVIDGVHLATIFLGQFFYEAPDLDYFRRQARKFGFDEPAYLAALNEVPIFSRQKVEDILEFNAGFVTLLTRMGIDKLRQIEIRKDLTRSENRFRALFDNANDGMFILSPDGRILEANREACKELGYEKNELLKLSVPKILSLSIAEEFAGRIREILRKKRLLFETVFRHRDGTTFPVEISVRSFNHFEQPALLASFRDITPRKEGEEAQKKALAAEQEAREKIDAILRSVADGLIVTDPENRVVLMNRAAETFANSTLEKALALPIDTLFPGAGFSKKNAAVLSGAVEDSRCEWESEAPQSKHPRTVLAHTAAVRTGSGEITGTITLLRDVTHERELDRMKNEFISTAAHELRTPLTSVMGFSEILLAPEQYHITEEARKRELAAHIHQKALQLETLVSDLLDLGKVQSGQMIPLSVGPLEIGAFLRRIVTGYPGDGKRIALSLPKRPTVIEADPAKLEQVLDNLISNAIKFSPPTGALQVTAEVSGSQVRIAVRDEGIGMTPEEIERVFDKFYRADPSDRGQAGMGLGMAIVRNIVEAHGGTITVESRPKKGTTVGFTLPLPSSPLQEEAVE